MLNNRGPAIRAVEAVISWYYLTWAKVGFLIFFLLLFLLMLFFANASANIASFWAPSQAYSFPLQDLGNDFFNVTDYTYGYNDAVDVLLICFCAFSGFVLLFNRLAVYIILKVMLALTIAYFLRSTCILVTSPPDTWQLGRRIIYDFFGSFNRYRGGDLVFSGHTLLTCTIASAWSSFHMVTDLGIIHWILGITAWIYAGLIMVLIVVGRAHYTVDVLLGAYIAVLLWWSLSYFETRLFEEPICKMKFRSSPIPPYTTRSVV